MAVTVLYIRHVFRDCSVYCRVLRGSTVAARLQWLEFVRLHGWLPTSAGCERCFAPLWELHGVGRVPRPGNVESHEVGAAQWSLPRWGRPLLRTAPLYHCSLAAVVGVRAVAQSVAGPSVAAPAAPHPVYGAL